MNSDTTYKTISSSSGATLALGERLGRRLKAGVTIELTGDLGAGKTVFIKGLAQGLGYGGEVSSPSFTISRVYQLPGGRQLHHFDFYRLAPGDIVDSELAEVMQDQNAIVAIEWAAHSGDTLPADRIEVAIKQPNESQREISIKGPKAIIQGLA